MHSKENNAPVERNIRRATIQHERHEALTAAERADDRYSSDGLAVYDSTA